MSKDTKIGTCADGSDCQLCAEREGYCQHHGDGEPVGSKGGRPSYEPSDQDVRTVKALSVAGWAQSRIAEIIGVSENTLRKHFAELLEVGEEKAIAKVTGTYYQFATSGQHPKATKEWLERRDPEHWQPPKKRQDITSDGDKVDASPVVMLPDNGKKRDDGSD